MCIDLHTHSYYSDGSVSPQELAAEAVDSGLRAVALTDHDTVEGLEEFLAAGNDRDIVLVPGLEVSATHRDFSVHILGYGMDHTDADLVEWLARLQEGRIKRNEQIIGKLRKMGHDIRIDELAEISQVGQTGRPHIARLMKNKGIVRSTEDAFSLYLRRGGSAWADRFSYSAAECIAMIHRAGGLAVLAHPGMLEQQTRALSLVIAELVRLQLDGVEVFYPTHTPATEKKLRGLARKYELVVTGGSDYHGKHRSFSTMAGAGAGFCPPDAILGPFLERLNNVQHSFH